MSNPAGTTKDSILHGEQLQLRKRVLAPPERVFRAWTNANELEQWWGPKDVRCVSATVDLRVGGHYRIGNEFPDGSIVWIIGEFEHIDEPNLLIFSWSIESASPTTERVTVQFEKCEDGTEILLKHERIATAILRDQHQMGWADCLSGLKAWFVNDTMT
jgi:uncharacterized protein YndB with AHSA1/START domain